MNSYTGLSQDSGRTRQPAKEPAKDPEIFEEDDQVLEIAGAPEYGAEEHGLVGDELLTSDFTLYVSRLSLVLLVLLVAWDTSPTDILTLGVLRHQLSRN